MTNFPKITMITPSLNQGNFIEQTIRSILEQGYPNLEYIVIDGSSTDQTLEILHRYEDQIIWSSEKDRGQSHALNKGLALATGDIIGFVNSDDYLEPDALFKVGYFFATYPKADCLTGRCHTVNERGQEIRKLITYYKNFLLLLSSYKLLFVINYISQPATFWRKKVTDAIGGFNESLHYSMEYEYWLRIGGRYQIHRYNDYLACFRVYSSSKAGSSANKPFDAQLAIAASFTKSKGLLKLQALHNRLIIYIYRHFLSRSGNLYSDKSSL